MSEGVSIDVPQKREELDGLKLETVLERSAE